MSFIPKFKVWDTENNKFFKPTYRAYQGELEDLSVCLSGDLMMRTMEQPAIHESKFKDRFILIQYTGLNDKESQPIYEGDIVQIKDHAFQGSIDIDGNYVVHYSENMELCCGSLILFRQLPYATVIGNRFANPDLLEAPHEQN